MSRSIPVVWRHRLSAVSDLSVQEPSSFKTDCTRTDYRRRNLGNSRYRFGGRCRNVHHRYCRHGVDPRRTGTTSYLFKSIGMKSSMVSFSTPNKDILKQIADRFNSKDYLIVSYEMETQHTGETGILSGYDGYQVETE